MDRAEYVKKYLSSTYHSVSFRLNKETEADIIAFLEGKPTKQYLVELIRKDMKRIARRSARGKQI